MQYESNTFGFAGTLFAQHANALVLILVEETTIREISEAVSVIRLNIIDEDLFIFVEMGKFRSLHVRR